MSISLVYIARGENAGFTAINKFIRAYKNFNPGSDHELIVVFKGWPKDKLQDEKILRNEFKKLNANILEFDDDGFDWGGLFGNLFGSDDGGGNTPYNPGGGT